VIRLSGHSPSQEAKCSAVGNLPAAEEGEGRLGLTGADLWRGMVRTLPSGAGIAGFSTFGDRSKSAYSMRELPLCSAEWTD
jgi:hypothetical protein